MPHLTFQWLTPSAVRITHLLAEGNAPAERAWVKDVLLPQARVEDGAARFTIEAESGRARARGPQGQVFFEEASPARLNLRRSRFFADLDIPKTELRFGRRQVEAGVQLALKTEPDELFYGWGERFEAFSRRQGDLLLRIRDAISLLQGSGHSYSAIPFFISSRGYGFFLLNSHASRWQTDAKNSALHIEAEGPSAEYILIYGPAYKDILSTYTALTGRPPLIPLWGFGLWVTGYPQENQAAVLNLAQKHRKRNIPLDAVILDYHWEEAFHNFHWRKMLIPKPDSLIAGLGMLGVRLGLILTPFLNARRRPWQKWLLNKLAHNLPRGAENSDERALPEYEQARAKGYLAHEDARWWFGAGGMLDFTNPAAVDWWNNKLRPLYEQGVAFVKNDDGEYLPEDAHSASGMDGKEYHNLYGFYYGKGLYEFHQAQPNARGLIYARSVWAGSQRYPALFIGDQKPTYECMRRALRAGLNLGLAGFAYWGADVFGLDGKTTPELHRRYAQFALLTPIARYFIRPEAIDDTRFPWSHGAENEDNFRAYAELRYRLLPYWYALAWESYQSGLPLLRPMMLEFPEAADLQQNEDQAMLGSRLLLAPILEAGAEQRQITLPEGVWHDFWTEQHWEGRAEITYPAPPDRLPLLARGSTILAIGPGLAHIPAEHRFNELELHLWPPFPAECTLYEDDGVSTAYQQGSYALTLIQAEWVENHADENADKSDDKNTDKNAGRSRRLAIRIAPAQGSFNRMPAVRRIRVVLHGGKKATQSEWRICPTNAETVIEILAETTQ